MSRAVSSTPTTPTHRGPVRRLVALAAVPALALGGLAATAGPAAAAADPRPTAVGADWLAGELTVGLAHNDQFDFDDYGLSIDAALGLDAVGGHDADVQAVADAIATNLTAYTSYDVAEGKTHVGAGQIAKALHLAQVAGRDGAAYGGQDLVQQLTDRVGTEGPTTGRIADVFFPEEDFESDFANTTGQGFAAEALAEAGSDSADDVLAFLLAQQCDAGFFRGTFAPADAADQACAGDAGVQADTDSTALTLLALADLQDQPGAAAATTRALDWLESVQAADGSFSGAPPTDAPNANSTGLAGWALGEYGRTTSAPRAATWVRARQADDPAACGSDLTSETGAIAYDDAGLARGRAEGIEVEAQDQFRRASAQALPALAYAPAGTTPQVTSPSASFRRPGAREVVGATGLAPGQSACITGPGAQVLKAVAAGGGVNATVTLPRTTGTSAYRVVTGAGAVGTASFRVLAPTKLGVDYKVRPKRGTNQRVVVKGLVQGESVAVTSRGSVQDRGTANAQGRFVARFKVGGKVGKAGLRVRGEFADRKASRSFVVVKGR